MIPQKPTLRTTLLLAVFGMLCSLGAFGVALAYSATTTLSHMAAPRSVGSILTSLLLPWLVASIFGYLPLILFARQLSNHVKGWVLGHIIMCLGSGLFVFFYDRSGPAILLIAVWGFASIGSLVVAAIKTSHDAAV
jgi:hypothetical protein